MPRRKKKPETKSLMEAKPATFFEEWPLPMKLGLAAFVAWVLFAFGRKTERDHAIWAASDIPAAVESDPLPWADQYR
jgi:hypothetical protein